MIFRQIQELSTVAWVVAFQTQVLAVKPAHMVTSFTGFPAVSFCVSSMFPSNKSSLIFSYILSLYRDWSVAQRLTVLDPIL